jgi:hypothetical protein
MITKAKPVRNKTGAIRKGFVKTVHATPCGLPKYGPGLSGGDKGTMKNPRSEEKWKG